MSITINLRIYYPWYKHDEFLEVSDAVAAELLADKRYQKTFYRVARRYKVLSLDAECATEAEACFRSTDNPEALLEMMERFCNLCRALNSLPEIQGRRVEAHYLLGKSIQQIAGAEGVSDSSVKESVYRGLRAMKKYFSNISENSPAKCP